MCALVTKVNTFVLYDQTLSNHLHALIHRRTLYLCERSLVFRECCESAERLGRGWQRFQSGKLRPRVVIGKREDECSPSPTYDLLQVEDTQQSLDPKVLRNFYSSVTVLHLAGERISPLARFRV
jgi:hypothetical protein